LSHEGIRCSLHRGEWILACHAHLLLHHHACLVLLLQHHHLHPLLHRLHHLRLVTQRVGDELGNLGRLYPRLGRKLLNIRACAERVKAWLCLLLLIILGSHR